MGGYGSGYNGLSRKTVENHSHIIDVGFICRHIPLRAGSHSSGFSYYRGGHYVGSMGFKAEHDGIRPTMISVNAAANGHPFNQELILKYQPMPKGGVRTLALCPYCYRKCLKLYFVEWKSQACCRICADLTYVSCQESNTDSGTFKYVGKALRQEFREEKYWQRAETNKSRCREWRNRPNLKVSLFGNWRK